MKRLALFLGIGFFVAAFVGCGVEQGEVPQAATVDRLLSEGWELYDAGDYEAAAAKFDSVIEMNISVPEAHLGYAWAQGQLHNLSDARPFFRMVEMVAFENSCMPLLIDTTLTGAIYVTSWGDTVMRVVVGTPVYGIERLVNSANRVQTVLFFNENEIWVEWDGVSTEDSFKLYYVSFDSTVVVPDYVDDVAWAYAGYGCSYVHEETGDEMKAVEAMNIALKLLSMAGDDTTFAHRPYLDPTDLKLMKALAAFRLGLYKNTVDILRELGWDEWQDDMNPYKVENWPIILQALENFMRGT